MASTNQCAACGQYADRSHRCPTPAIHPESIPTLPRGTAPTTTTERVTRAQTALASSRIRRHPARPDHPKWGTWNRDLGVYEGYENHANILRDENGLLHSPGPDYFAYAYLDDDSDPWQEDRRLYHHGMLIEHWTLTDYGEWDTSIKHNVDWENTGRYGIWDKDANAYASQTVEARTDGTQTITTQYRNSRGKLHNENGPALTRVHKNRNGGKATDEEWAVNGKLHRPDGYPAKTRVDALSATMRFYEDGKPTGSPRFPGKPTYAKVRVTGPYSSGPLEFTRAWETKTGKPKNGPNGLPAYYRTKHASPQPNDPNPTQWAQGQLPTSLTNGTAGIDRSVYVNREGKIGSGPSGKWTYYNSDGTAALYDANGTMTRLQIRTQFGDMKERDPSDTRLWEIAYESNARNLANWMRGD